MTNAARSGGRVTRLIDIVFPGDTNHHGTLFGGIGLADMDKVAFIAASRHGHCDFVTASCDRIDFEAPARLGEIVELTARVVRVGRRSLGVETDLVAEHVLTGERRRCTRGVFTMVAIGEPYASGGALPPLDAETVEHADDDGLRMVEMVFPDQTSHYGSLYGGNALAAMGKAAFVAATRRSRKAVVMASSQRVDFMSQVRTGEVIELCARVDRVGRSSMTIAVELHAENLLTGERRLAGHGCFVMVALGENERPVAIEA
ncbi:acyl-CoA thioesterase [Marinivivus vitaminiproducens]|uniref:acyl-CoA thioesterase n=1 Tax=Marinivivus vitaminiproducens TaxID=3035935 RepID=UPI00279D65A7|nr:hotdog domain-containing protein [Geminicoccaceae bacterium SCSIO 64248]